jgi:hypothetical protein
VQHRVFECAFSSFCDIFQALSKLKILNLACNDISDVRPLAGGDAGAQLADVCVCANASGSKSLSAFVHLAQGSSRLKNCISKATRSSFSMSSRTSVRICDGFIFFEFKKRILLIEVIGSNC